MQIVDGRTIYSGSDLNRFLGCRTLTALDFSVVGKATEPGESDPQLEILAGKGIAHERRYLASLEASGERVVRIPEYARHSIAAFQAGEAATFEAMESGAQTIYQATFFDGTWFGRADFLHRVERPAAGRAWSYEVEDAKLALAEKPYFLIQLCFYSEQLERLLGVAPEFAHVLLGNGERRSFRLDEYSAYFRHLKASFLAEIATLQGGALAERLDETPMPVAHCELCTWSERCARLREERDHLSLVARIRADQIRRLAEAEPPILTMHQLAAARDRSAPPNMSHETFVTLRRQARLQVRQNDSETPQVELLEPEENRGFGLLPEPDVGDLFFDMEGDPLYEPGRGLEYLFGLYLSNDDRFIPFWGTSRTEERDAFERFVDFLVERRQRYPNLHVYHYASYEKNALRKLSTRHGTREAEIDDILRSELLVDLLTVVRQALCVGSPRYSIKKLELYYNFRRVADLRSGDDSVVMFERWLLDPTNGGLLETIERYNEEDCRSTFHLREWLLQRRNEAEQHFSRTIPWRPKREPQTLEGERAAALAALTDLQRKLIEGLPPVTDAADLQHLEDAARIRWIFAQLLSYHRREEKPLWWKIFDAAEMSLTEHIEDGSCLGGLTLLDKREPDIKGKARNRAYTYGFPEQEYTAQNGMLDPLTIKFAGTIVDIDEKRRRICIRRSGDIERARTLTALIPAPPIDTGPLRRSLVRIAEALPNSTLHRARPRAAIDVLLRRPRIKGIGERGTIQPERPDAESILPLLHRLDESYLFIQGPPGSGKSTIASETIATLLGEGKRIGVMSTSHKAIQHLLGKVERAAAKQRVEFRGLYKTGSDGGYESPLATPFIKNTANNGDFVAGACELAAGTGWLFSREDFGVELDYLFVDEAGQIALANAVAVAPAAKNLVFFGDPLQLAQVSQGVHPAGMGRSVLSYLLGDDATVPPERGIFLDTSFRMHPDICSFISAHVYAGRLKAAPETAKSLVESSGLAGAGLRFLPVEHADNARESVEEAERIIAEIRRLRKGRVRVGKGKMRAIADGDILIVTPYNAQRLLLQSLLEEAGFSGVRVGTVDKFQGQEAPIVFYTMATSSIEEAPRGIDFLFEKNRFNVAISRAQCMSVLVANPALLDIRCTTVEQMATIDLLCRFIESA